MFLFLKKFQFFNFTFYFFLISLYLIYYTWLKIQQYERYYVKKHKIFLIYFYGR